MGCISVHILRFFFVLCISFASDLSESLTGLLSDIKLRLELSLASPISEFSLPTHVMCISSAFSFLPPLLPLTLTALQAPQDLPSAAHKTTLSAPSKISFKISSKLRRGVSTRPYKMPGTKSPKRIFHLHKRRFHPLACLQVAATCGKVRSWPDPGFSIKGGHLSAHPCYEQQVQRASGRWRPLGGAAGCDSCHALLQGAW